MRLTCPNCGAQYEVPDEVIPHGGRDVQCSNCGDTWFQEHPDHAAAAPQDDEPVAGAEAPPPPPPPSPHGTSHGSGSAQAGIASAPAAGVRDHAPASERQQPGPDRAPSPADAGRRVDPAVAEILRQEAERERAVRAAAAAGGVETQPDLGLRAPGHDDDRGRQARARMDRLRGGTPAAAAHDAERIHDIDPDTRSNLLPDIEEINSSLAAHDDFGPEQDDDLPENLSAPARQGGFRRGFRLAVLIFILATILYLLAPRIAAQLPAAEAPLAGYVRMVDALRLWVDGRVGALTGWISDMSQPAPPPGN